MAAAASVSSDAGPGKFESKDLEIKTKSIEQTLIPLVTQITTLVNHREKPKRSEKTCKAIERVGQAVNLAVERFVTVGEAIGDDDHDIQNEMYRSCQEARLAGKNIAKLTIITYDEMGQVTNPGGKGAMIQAARGLLSAVTRVLLLADRVVVKQITAAKDKVTDSLNKIEKAKSFTQFVQCFSQFGKEMVELAHLTGDRQNDLKNEKAKAKMGAARAVLEKSTMMLLTSCKTCLRHPDCQPARDTRNGVFSSMRRALAMIDDVIFEGYETKPRGVSSQNGVSSSRNLHAVLQELSDLVQTARVTQADCNTRRKMMATLDAVIDTTQDFTDSAYTSHEHRERILNLNARAKKELKLLADVGVSIDGGDVESTEDQLGVCVLQLSQTITDLRKQLQSVALAQGNEIFRTINDSALLASMKDAAATGNLDRLEEKTNDFTEHTEQLQETCQILGHVATLAPLAISADYAENNLRTLAPQIVASATTVAINANSKIAKENLDVFCDTWECQMNELSILVKEISDVLKGRNAEKQVYLSLPRPGKHGSSPKLVKPAKLDAEGVPSKYVSLSPSRARLFDRKHENAANIFPAEVPPRNSAWREEGKKEQAKIAKLGLEMKLMTSELDAETDKWDEPDNDIVKRAKNMSSMAYSMYLFTRGEGLLKTTQDLFKQAEYFAEEGNKLFRSVKEFAIQVPDCPMRSDLICHLEQIPTFCQQLNFTTKSGTSGKAATFNKVDSTILETKNLMSTIGKLVPLCYILALKYQIETPDSPISKWRTAPPPMMDLRSNGDDLDSVGSYESSRSSGSLLMSSMVQKPMQNLNAFERIAIE